MKYLLLNYSIFQISSKVIMLQKKILIILSFNEIFFIQLKHFQLLKKHFQLLILLLPVTYYRLPNLLFLLALLVAWFINWFTSFYITTDWKVDFKIWKSEEKALVTFYTTYRTKYVLINTHFQHLLS